MNQLQKALEVANEKLGTHFRLGQVTEGYWSQWEEKKKAYDNKLYKTSVVVDSGHAAGEPMVFIHNYNKSRTAHAHNEKGDYNHVSRSFDIVFRFLPRAFPDYCT